MKSLVRTVEYDVACEGSKVTGLTAWPTRIRNCFCTDK